MLSGLRNERRPPYGRETFRADLFAGIVMSASYVPGAMALGVVSGMGPLAALWCCVLVGTIAALSGGTRALVSGPSAVLAVIAATLLAGNEIGLSEFAVIVVMAGAFQIALGLAGLGRFVSYMPHIVIAGLMSGIGVLILWSQAQNLLRLGASDVVLAACCLTLLLMWPARVGKFLPSGLAVIGAGWLCSLFVPGVEPLGPVPVGLPVPVLEMPSIEFLRTAVGPAALIALVGSVYTLMWALNADSFTGSQHNPDRELFGIGLSNLAAGFAGVLPGSANIGTATARRLGGKTVVAGLVCMVVVAALILGVGPHVAPLPVAALSAIVMLVGWNLIDFSFLRKVPRADRGHAAVMLLIMGVTIFVDPLIAVVFGVIAANIVNAMQLEPLELDSVISTPLLDATLGLEPSDEYEARAGLLAFRGSFTVSSSRKLTRLIGNEIREHEVVIFDFSATTHVDDSAAQLIAHLVDQARQASTKVIIFGANDRIRKALYAFGVLDRIAKDRIVETEEDARILARSLLRRRDPSTN
ncbi:MAG: SulP family inorganic anion transporter [Boseongicola sp.]|nr:SulP family inorganic anion transporter [Boseongicola sp.]